VMLSRRWAPTELQAVLAIVGASASDPEGSAALSHRRLGEILSTSGSVAGATLRRLADRGVIRRSRAPKPGGPNRYALNARPNSWRVPEKTGGAKERIIREANGRCYYCGAKVDPGTLELDHVMPVSLGGARWAANLVAACRECNRKKDVLGPAEFFRAMRKKRRPRPGEVVCPLLALPCPIGGPFDGTQGRPEHGRGGGPPTRGADPSPGEPAKPKRRTRLTRRRTRAPSQRVASASKRHFQDLTPIPGAKRMRRERAPPRTAGAGESSFNSERRLRRKPLPSGTRY
jgi:hypothetical protein